MKKTEKEFLYMAFYKQRPVENFWGIIEFSNNELGTKIHSKVFNYLNDLEFKVRKVSESEFDALYFSNATKKLVFNGRTWALKDLTDLETFEACIEAGLDIELATE